MIASTIPQITLPTASRGERATVVALVVAAHVGLTLAWMMQPESPAVAVSEMSVSVAIQQAETAKPQAQPEPPKPQPRVERAEKPAPKPPEQEEAKAVPQPAAATPVAPPAQAAPPVATAAPVTDTAPDYKAAYLNNPQPPYPKTASRMGWEGRVVLNVEVLATGLCGDINVFQTSGHEVLDNAALRTVKGWRFVPASRVGHPVTQWFKVPIKFSLKESET